MTNKQSFLNVKVRKYSIKNLVNCFFFFDLYSDVQNLLLKSLVRQQSNYFKTMKKFLLSATLLVAFSLTSFAAEKTTNDSKDLKASAVKEKTEVATKEKTTDCTTLHL